MSDQREEQEMEAEALEAIFESAFEQRSSDMPMEWAVKLLPVDCGGDEEAEEKENHVGIRLLVKLPLDYPEHSFADLDIEIIKGLTDDHRIKLLDMATEEAEANEGMPQIYAICEVLREWLVQNNEPGQADDSMHAQMLRRAKEEKEKKAAADLQYEAQKQQDVLTEAEAEELAVRKRRAEGTPCTLENFETWKAQFEMELLALQQDDELNNNNNDDTTEGGSSKKKSKGSNSTKAADEKAGRLTGFQQFSGKMTNLDAIEQAAQDAEDADVTAEELEEFDEDLFDEDDDEDLDDLDDLDFDDEDDDEEEPDI